MSDQLDPSTHPNQDISPVGQEAEQAFTPKNTPQTAYFESYILIQLAGRSLDREILRFERIHRSKTADSETEALLVSLRNLRTKWAASSETEEAFDGEAIDQWYASFVSEWQEITNSLVDWDTRHPLDRAWRQLPVHTLPLTDTLRFASDNINGAAVRAFSSPQGWLPNPIDEFAYGIEQRFKNLEITIGLPNGEQATSLWEFLCKGGPRMVKSHYALWARWYEEEGHPSEAIIINISQFCADLGYKKHHKGGFRRENKQEAIRILEALTSIEIRAIFTAPRSKKATRLRGPLWSRGMIAEEQDQYADLFGQSRAGDPALWEPLAFSYTPGPWFQNADWRAYNYAVGKISAGLMRLDNNNDQWSILIGGYLGTLVRTNKYRPKRLRINTILNRTGLAQDNEARRRATETRGYMERALQRLLDVGVIKKWCWVEGDVADLNDSDDPTEIAEYYAVAPLPANDWRRKVVEITFGMEADAARLEAQQALHFKPA